MSDQAYAGPKRTWRFNKQTYSCHDYRLDYYSLFWWGFSDGCRGFSARTPWGAWLGWNRWRKEPNMPA